MRVRLTEPANQLAILIAAAFLLGGGGVRYGLLNLVVQLVALGVLAANRRAVAAFFGQAPLPLRVLIGLTLLLPTVQAISLPPHLWQTLPGRDLVSQSFERIGQADVWFPLSVDRGRTLLSLAGLIAPFAILAVGWSTQRPQVAAIPLVIAAIGLVSVIPGTAQVLSGTAILYPQNEMPGVMFGLFANRNTAALFFVIALLMLGLMPPVRPLGAMWISKAAAAVVLVTAVFTTQSRSGLGLLALPAIVAAARAVWLFRLRKAARKGSPPAQRGAAIAWAVGAVLAAALAAAVAVPAMPGSRIGTALTRFESTEVVRPQIWEDGMYAAERYWPAGAGMGTFDEVFQVDESLEYLSARRAGRAHNDYLEIAIEAGAAGLALVAAWALWLVWAGANAARCRDPWPALGAAAGLVAIALQSAVDYPLRNQAMLCTAAMLLLLVIRLGSARPERPANDRAEP